MANPNNTTKRIEWLLICLGSPEIELDDWEQGFYEDIERKHKFNKGKKESTLTDGQYEKLEEVYERRTQ